MMVPISTPPTATHADAVLLAASLTDPERFAEVYDRHHAVVFRYLRSRLGDDLVDDAVADTFVEAFRIRGRFDVERGDDCAPWLLGIATNVAARRRGAEQRWLRNQRATLETEATPDEHEDADERIVADRLAPWLAVALGDLRRRDRDALLLYVAGDLSIGEVAAALGIAPGTVKSRLHRARTILAAKLEVRR